MSKSGSYYRERAVRIRSSVRLASASPKFADAADYLRQALVGLEAEPELDNDGLHGLLDRALSAAELDQNGILMDACKEAEAVLTELVRHFVPSPEFAAEVPGTNGNTVHVQYTDAEPGLVTVAVLGPRGAVLGRAKLDKLGVDALVRAAQRGQTSFVRAGEQSGG
jgi:hypothetical protein